MKNIPLLELFKTLSPDEITNFKKFLKSPYYNNRSVIISLFKEIIKFYPDFSEKKLNKEYLYFKIIKKGSYNDNTIRGLLSRLDKLAYDFFVIENIKKRELSFLNILLKELNYRNIVNSFIHVTKKKGKERDLPEKIDTGFLLDKYFYDANIINYSKLHDRFISSKGKLAEHMKNFETMSENLVIFSISTLISDFIPAILYHHEFQFNINDFISKIFLGSIDPWLLYEKIKLKNPNSFLLKLHLKLIEAFNNIDDQISYDEYKKCLLDNMNKITKDELNFHFSCLMNLCSIKHDKRVNATILKEEYELNLLSIKLGIYKNDNSNFFPLDLFRSVIILGIKLRDYENVENFINSYNSELQLSERKNYQNFGFAFLRFAQGKFSESIRYSFKVSVDHYILKYDMRNLTLKLYYELNDFEKSFDLIHSYKEFLNNNIFTTPDKKKLYSNFIRYYRYLISRKSGDLKVDIEYFYTKFKKERQISDKEWLNDKFNELLNKSMIVKTVI